MPFKYPESEIPYKKEDRGYKTLCWIWQRATSRDGYGSMRTPTGETMRPHKYYYIKTKGPIPSGCEIDHLCSVKNCVNPDHLEAVNHVTNVRRGKVTKLSKDQIDIIRDLVGCGMAYAQIAEMYDVCTATISHIANNRNWK